MRFKLIIPDTFGHSFANYTEKNSWKEAIEYVENIERIIGKTVLIYEIDEYGNTKKS